MTRTLLDAVEEIRPLIQQHAAAAEADRRLGSGVYDAMYGAGLFSMLAYLYWRKAELRLTRGELHYLKPDGAILRVRG